MNQLDVDTINPWVRTMGWLSLLLFSAALVLQFIGPDKTSRAAYAGGQLDHLAKVLLGVYLIRGPRARGSLIVVSAAAFVLSSLLVILLLTALAHG
jgi:hypothetical protein